MHWTWLCQYLELLTTFPTFPTFPKKMFLLNEKILLYSLISAKDFRRFVILLRSWLSPFIEAIALLETIRALQIDLP